MAGNFLPLDGSLQVGFEDWLYRLTEQPQEFPAKDFDKKSSGEALTQLCVWCCVEVEFVVVAYSVIPPDGTPRILRVRLTGTGSFVNSWSIASGDPCDLIDAEIRRIDHEARSKLVFDLDSEGNVCLRDADGNIVGDGEQSTIFDPDKMLRWHQRELHQPVTVKLRERVLPHWEAMFGEEAPKGSGPKILTDEQGRFLIEPGVTLKLTSRGQKAKKSYLDGGFTSQVEQLCGITDSKTATSSHVRLNVVDAEMVHFAAQAACDDEARPEAHGAYADEVIASETALRTDEAGPDGYVENPDRSKYFLKTRAIDLAAKGGVELSQSLTTTILESYEQYGVRWTHPLKKDGGLNKQQRLVHEEDWVLYLHRCLKGQLDDGSNQCNGFPEQTQEELRQAEMNQKPVWFETNPE